jgi:hypothetical protein
VFFKQLSVSTVRNTTSYHYNNIKEVKLKIFWEVTSICTRLGQQKEAVIFSGNKNYNLNTRIYCGVDPCGRTVSGVGLCPPASWDCKFESRRKHEYLSVVSIVCCEVEVSETDRSLVQRGPIVGTNACVFECVMVNSNVL